MSGSFSFINHIDGEAGPAPKDPTEDLADAESDKDDPEPQDIWDNQTDHNNINSSPNTSIGSPTFESHHGLPFFSEDHPMQDSQPSAREGLRLTREFGLAREFGFRKNVNRTVFKGSGYVDRDESGNYDPKVEAAARRKATKRKVVAKPQLSAETVEDDVGDTDNEDEPKAEPKNGKENGTPGDRVTKAPDVVVEGLLPPGDKEKETSDAGDSALLSTKETMKQMPKGVVDTEMKVAEESEEESEEDEEEDEESDDADSPTKPARNAKKKEANAPTPQICEPCHEFDLECSILDDPDQYPCTTCCEENIPCVLANPTTAKSKAGSAAAKVEAKKKQKEREKREKEREKMEAKRLKQIATWIIKPQDRKYIACAPCRRERTNCPLKTKNDVGPCRKCISKKSTCTFEDKVVKTPKAGKGGKKKNTSKNKNKDRKNSNTSKTTSFNESRKSSLFSTHRKPSLSTKVKIPPGMFKTRITTSFCHPITFNVQANPFSQSPPCPFHTTIAFALLGLGEVTVDVLAPKHPSAETPFAYTEIPTDDPTKSHAAAGEEPTSLCIPCTFDRLRIIQCSAHFIRGLSGVGDPRAFDYDDAFSKVLSDQEMGLGSNEAGRIKWCSVCVAPAFYECCAPAQFGRGGEPIAADNDLGCGLLLCDICAKGLCGGKVVGVLEDVRMEELGRRASEAGSARTGYAGSGYDAKGKGVEIPHRRSVGACVDLDTLVARARGDVFAYEDGVRADAGLLTTEGELVQWWLADMGEDGEEGAGEGDMSGVYMGESDMDSEDWEL